MGKKLSDIQGIKIPDYSKHDLKKILSKDDLWEFLINVYPDMIKADDVVKSESSATIDVQIDNHPPVNFTSGNVESSDMEEKIWKKTSQVNLTKLLI